MRSLAHARLALLSSMHVYTVSKSDHIVVVRKLGHEALGLYDGVLSLIRELACNCAGIDPPVPIARSCRVPRIYVQMARRPILEHNRSRELY